jgi:hypothetical protein
MTEQTERKGLKVCKETAYAIRQMVATSLKITNGRLTPKTVKLLREYARDDAGFHDSENNFYRPR